jgi:hypothetical protein
MATEFASIDTRSEILSIINRLVAEQEAALRTPTMAAGQSRRMASWRL